MYTEMSKDRVRRGGCTCSRLQRREITATITPQWWRSAAIGDTYVHTCLSLRSLVAIDVPEMQATLFLKRIRRSRTALKWARKRRVHGRVNYNRVNVGAIVSRFPLICQLTNYLRQCRSIIRDVQKLVAQPFHYVWIRWLLDIWGRMTCATRWS